MDWEAITAAPARSISQQAPTAEWLDRSFVAGFATGLACGIAVPLLVKHSALPTNRTKADQHAVGMGSVRDPPEQPPQAVSCSTAALDVQHAGAEENSSCARTGSGNTLPQPTAFNVASASGRDADGTATSQLSPADLAGPLQPSALESTTQGNSAPLHTVLAEHHCRTAVQRACYSGHRQLHSSNAHLLMDIIDSPNEFWTLEDQAFVMDCKRKLDFAQLAAEHSDAGAAQREMLRAATGFLEGLYEDMRRAMKSRLEVQNAAVRAQKEGRAVRQHAAQRTQACSLPLFCRAVAAW